MAKTPSTVVCTAAHVIDLADGRTLEPGETAEGVDTSSPHNRGLVIDGALNVIDGTTPRVRHSEQLVEDAETDAEVANDDKNKEAKG